MTPPPAPDSPPHQEKEPLRVTAAEVRRTLQRINPRKAAGPDNISGRVLKGCAYQLTEVLTDIFNTSLQQAAVPTCLKTATIIPIPKTPTVTGLNDYRPVALTPIVMKCFERLVMAHIKDCVDVTVDPHQYAYRKNRSTEDAISSVVHTALTHLENKDSYVRLLFVDFTSAFNTIQLYNYTVQTLVQKLTTLSGLSSTLCNWVLDFLTDRPQSVRIHDVSSSSISLSTGSPQGLCAEPPPVHPAHTRLLSDTSELSDREQDQGGHSGLQEGPGGQSTLLSSSTGKQLSVSTTIKFLGIHITSDLTWSMNTAHLVKKAQQRLFFLRKLKRAGLSPQLLTNFYRATIESILCLSAAVWYGSCTAKTERLSPGGENSTGDCEDVLKMSDATDHPVKASTADTSSVACQTSGDASGKKPGMRLPEAGVGKTLTQQIKTTMKEDFKPASANAQGGSAVHFDLLPKLRVLEVIDTVDRPGSAFAIGTYADAETYVHGGENKPGKRIPKAGAYARAGVGLARAEWSIFEAEAKGPNASAGAEASVALLGAEAFAQAEVGSASASAAGILEANVKGPNVSAGAKASVALLGAEAFAQAEVGSASASAAGILEANAKGPNTSAEVAASVMRTGAFARAELASVSASAGPLRTTLGLSADTGVSIGATGLEVKILGTGFSTGSKTSVSLLGNEVECNALGGLEGYFNPLLLKVTNTADRPGSASAIGTYADAETYVHRGENKPGKRIPKAGACARAGVGLARAEYSVFEAEAKGPNASAEAEASVMRTGAFARAQLASASASAGPLRATVGLSADTGVSIGAEGLEVKILGTGFTIGPTTSFSVL
ncbi:hypothetical protein L3Q82_016220, partial [Scortum barcoo]